MTSDRGTAAAVRQPTARTPLIASGEVHVWLDEPVPVTSALRQRADCGVDAEACDRDRDTAALASLCLTAEEQEALARVPAAGQAEWVMRYWTLKEAYSKARGLGLSLPFAGFGFEWAPTGEIRLRPDPVPGDRATPWQFWQRGIGTRHVVAVAVRRDTPDPRRIVWHTDPPDHRG